MSDFSSLILPLLHQAPPYALGANLSNHFSCAAFLPFDVARRTPARESFRSSAFASVQCVLTSFGGFASYSGQEPGDRSLHPHCWSLALPALAPATLAALPPTRGLPKRACFSVPVFLIGRWTFGVERWAFASFFSVC